MGVNSGKKISLLGFVFILISTVIVTSMSAMLNITGFMGEGPLPFETIFTLFTVGDILSVIGSLAAAAGFFFIYNEERENLYLLICGALLIPAFYSLLMILGVSISFGGTTIANTIGNIVINAIIEAYLVLIAFSAIKKRNIIAAALLALAYIYKAVGATVLNNLAMARVAEGMLDFSAAYSMVNMFSILVSVGVCAVCAIHTLKDF